MTLRNIFEDLAYSEKMEIVICDIWNTGSCKRYPDLENDGKKVVKILQQYIPSFEKAIFLGNNQYPVTNFWREFAPSAKDHPKTDIKIGQYRISLKFKHKHRVMNSGKAEAQAIFYCAAMNNKHTGFFNRIKDNYFQKFQVHKREDPEETALQENLKQELANYFNENEDFIMGVIKEALTGFYKFGSNSDACASHILLFSSEETTFNKLNDTFFKSVIPHTRLNVEWVKRKRDASYRSNVVLRESLLTDILYKIKSTWVRMLNYFGLTPNVKIEIEL